MTADDRTVRAERGPPLHQRGLVFALALDLESPFIRRARYPRKLNSGRRHLVYRQVRRCVRRRDHADKITRGEYHEDYHGSCENPDHHLGTAG